ncbi:glutaminyl-peptide cyclotransferase [Maribacter algicola]|uniref:Glutaminyl-peptide cyclotransferase n=1 Tax=Meishania litoralis TaxID=3434685 RepID=A0ACC7LMB3_9FLAO
MNMGKFFLLNTSMLFFLACGGNENAKLFELRTDGNQFEQNEAVEVSVVNSKDKEINKITYSIDTKTLPEKDGKIMLDVQSLGNKTLTAKIEHEDGSTEISKEIRVLSAKTPEIYTYEIVNEYPHDIKAYTQGLEFHNDTLYESTGHKGTSWLRKVDYKSGKVLKQIDLDDTYFGEGITIMDGKIYQLTWQNRTGFIYDLKDFKKLDNFQYGESKEGWGLTNNGKTIYKSDGTEKIWLLNPDTLIEEGYIQIVTNKSLFNKANELEYVDGKLYANVYQKESMMIINASSGAIEGVINFGGLKEKVTQHEKLDVLNGVAYHPERKTFFVTGKNWDKLFEVKILKK